MLESSEAADIGLALNGYLWRMSKDQKIKFRHQTPREYLVQYFNRDGNFHSLLLQFTNEDGTERETGWFDKYAVYLGAYCMRLGVAIEKKDLEILRCSLARADIYPEAKAQMERALEHYKSNGERWDFESNAIGSKPNPGRSIEDGLLEKLAKLENLMANWEEEAKEMVERLTWLDNLMANGEEEAKKMVERLTWLDNSMANGEEEAKENGSEHQNKMDNKEGDEKV